MAASVPNQIIAAIVSGLQTGLSLTQDQCYQAIVEGYIDGQEADNVVQVIPDETPPEGPGTGGQDGGILIRRQYVSLVIWRKLKLDMHQHSEMVLSEDSIGMLDFCESIKNLFALTTLGGLLVERMRYENASATTWYDMDAGIVRRSMRFSCMFGEALPSAVTL